NNDRRPGRGRDMTAGRFACLRTHSWHSLLEGTAPPQALRQRAAGCGYLALALTDTNSLTGAVEFVAAARSADLRPIPRAHLVQQSQRGSAGAGTGDEQRGGAGHGGLCAVRVVRLTYLERPPWFVQAAGLYCVGSLKFGSVYSAVQTLMVPSSPAEASR